MTASLAKSAPNTPCPAVPSPPDGWFGTPIPWTHPATSTHRATFSTTPNFTKAEQARRHDPQRRRPTPHATGSSGAGRIRPRCPW
jgi:hypothetical protein